MSSIDHAKKQAKRLLKFTTKNVENNLPKNINHLNDALCAVATMNGFESWHDYRLYLQRNDMLNNKKDINTERKNEKELINRKECFLNEVPVKTLSKQQKIYGMLEKIHNAIYLGYDQENMPWLLNQYPLFIQGTTGSAKTATLSLITSRYIENNESVVYLDGKNDKSLFNNLCMYAKENNREEDIIHFDFTNKKLTIDPINSMVNNEEYFIELFDKEIGGIIFAVLNSLKKDNKIITMSSISGFLSLTNLIQWSTQLKDVNIKEYLKNIGYVAEITEEVIEKHILRCRKAYETIDIITKNPDLFSHNPEIDLKDIITNNKIMLASGDINKKGISNIFWIISNLVMFTEQEMNNYGYIQNIIFDEFNFYINKNSQDRIIDFLKRSKSNYILSCRKEECANKVFINNIMEISNTFVTMKQEPKTNFPDYLKIQITENMPEIPPVFYINKNPENYTKEWCSLSDLKEGEMIVFCDNKSKNKAKIINNDSYYYIKRLTVFKKN